MLVQTGLATVAGTRTYAVIAGACRYEQLWLMNGMTRILTAIDQGDPQATEELLPMVGVNVRRSNPPAPTTVDFHICQRTKL